MDRKKLLPGMLAAILILLVVLTSCGNDNEQGKVTSGQDKYLTQQLLSEREVINGQIYIEGDYALGTIIIKDGVSQARINTLANHYARKIKDRYAEKKVNVQAVQGGKNVADINL